MDKIDPNHDIVPTLRMFDGLIMGQAADKIESYVGDPLPAQEQEKPQEPVADKQPLALNAQTQPMWDYLVSQSKCPLRWETYLDRATKVRARVGANQYQPVGANDTMKLYAVINPEGEIRYVDYDSVGKP